MPASPSLRPEVQGDRFERTFAELLTRLIGSDLELTLLEVIRQPRGSQGGRDLQVRWKNLAGRTRFWHFECKSTKRKVLTADDLAPKIVQEAMAPHDIDVWCLASPTAEPSKEIDDLINGAAEKFNLDFALVALSRARGGINWLYACHPDLYEEQFEEPAPNQTAKERARRVTAFGEWLESCSRERPRGGPLGWSFLTPGRIGPPPEDPQTARAYLTGLTTSCPWEAVVYDWSVPRAASEASLLQAVEGMAPGLDYQWLISAAGEGRSTVLRRLAWQVLNKGEARVLWADEEGAADVPLEWLERMPVGAKVLLCVDGSGQLSRLREGLASSARLAEQGVSVLLVLTDRGSLFKGHSVRHRVPHRMRREPLILAPLSEAERGELVERLERWGLLTTGSRDFASGRLAGASAAARRASSRNSWETSWLVPAVMEITDPARRPFLKILGSVLEELSDDGEDDALDLLLMISLLHAAGPALPVDLAERLLGSERALAQALEILSQELERKLEAGGDLSLHMQIRYVTHGAAVSDGFVRAALANERLFRRLSMLAARLPPLMKPEYTASTALRQDRFEILDRVTTYVHKEKREPELAVNLLAAWVDLDPNGFAALHRLGNAYLHWMQKGLEEDDFNERELIALADRSRDCFREALRVAEEVLTGADVPAPYVDYKLDETKRFIFNSWGVLELTVGDPDSTSRRSDVRHLFNAVFLALMSLAVPGHHLTVATGLLARVLVAMKEFELAAPILAVNLALPGKHKLQTQLRRRVEEAGIDLPDGGIASLSAAIEDIVKQLIVPHWDQLEVESTVARHQDLMRTTLLRLSDELPTPVQVPSG